MDSNKKLLLLTGLVLFIISAIYIASASVPNTAMPAILFPLSILGLLFGLGFIVWAVLWILLSRTKILK
ncbi:hypothetical protein ACFL1B_02020 [Nanoarchaeota archaeon]